MKPADTRSSADDAFGRFRRILADKRLFRMDDGQLSESDTRSKFIDPLFKDVLGWSEVEIRREKPVSKGYVDYVLGAEYNHLLIEAKRAKPRFQLSAPGRGRRLKLDGPHLLENRKLSPFLHQAQGYASDVGVQFCLVTNGSQFVIFRPYLPGRPWKQGTAIVFHDHRDIEQCFAEFYALLARDRVVAGSLVEAFEHLERTTEQMFTPINFVADPERELIRNSVWHQIARTMGPLLTDQSEDLSAQLEVIEHCYVTTQLADETDKSLNDLLRDAPGRHLQDARVVDLRPGTRGRTAFSHRIERDIYGKATAYILTGGVGSGKTTFLRRFANIVDREFVSQHTVWLHVDFLRIGNVDPLEIDRHLRAYVYRRIREQIKQSYGSDLLQDGDSLRKMFDDEIREAQRTLLYGVEQESAEWRVIVNELVDRLYQDDERMVGAALRHLRRRGRRIAVVLDNTDQLGETFQASVFLFAQKLSADFEALCVVTLREEKFFAAYRRGIFDAFGDRRFHIGSPDLRQVLRKRLEYGRMKFAKLQQQGEGADISADELRRIDILLQVAVASTTRNSNIVRMLASVSNGDMRHALDMFRDFLSSGNTNVEKIIHIAGSGRGGYNIPFHEFAKSAILGSRKYYRSSLSHIVNVFKQSDALGASHLTASRILARLSAAEGVASPHGEGFVTIAALLREYRQSFGFAEDFVQWCGELLRRNLLESEPPRVADLNDADAVRITAAGSYYWRYLLRSFAYVDLVFVDTPIADEGLARRLAVLADDSDMHVRFERVRAFLDYLVAKESAELAVAAERVGPFQQALVPDLRKQIEDELRTIARKLKLQAAEEA